MICSYVRYLSHVFIFSFEIHCINLAEPNQTIIEREKKGKDIPVTGRDGL
jgi:hypothetical protein